MTLGNMRRQGVQHLISYCLNDACRHQALIDVSSYSNDVEVPWFHRHIKCGKCGRRGHWVDVRPNRTRNRDAGRGAVTRPRPRPNFLLETRLLQRQRAIEQTSAVPRSSKSRS